MSLIFDNALLFGAACFLLLWLSTSIMILKPKEGRVIFLLGGKVVREIERDGIYFKMPFPIHTASKKIDLSVRPFSRIDADIKAKNEAYTKMTIDGVYRVQEGHLQQFLFNVDDQFEVLESILTSELMKICSKLTLKQIYASQDLIAEQLTASANKFFMVNGLVVEKIIVKNPESDSEITTLSNMVFGIREGVRQLITGEQK